MFFREAIRAVVCGFLIIGSSRALAVPLSGLKWTALSPQAEVEGAMLRCDVPDALAAVNGLVQAHVRIPDEAIGRAVRLRVKTMGGVITRRARPSGGFRLMLDYTDLLTLKSRWMNARFPSDTLQPGVVEGVYDLREAQVGDATVTLGLERSAGHVAFDLSTLEMEVIDLESADDPAVRARRLRRIEERREFLAKSAALPVPEGVAGDPESLEGALRLESAFRLRICLNGLWRSRPVEVDDVGEKVPAAYWGWFKVPAVLATAQQRPVDAPAVRALRLKPRREEVWYRRTFAMPREAADRRVSIVFEMVSTRVRVFVDGMAAGEVSFPLGEVDITKFVRPGERQTLALYVTAYPADPLTQSYNAPDRSAEVTKTKINQPGVTGDVWLDISPKDVRLEAPFVETSVRQRAVTFVARAVKAPKELRLRAKVEGCGASRTFVSELLTPAADGSVRFTALWPDVRLWDCDAGGNLYTCRLSAEDVSGRLLDETVPFRFGFRDVKIEGRNLLVNGKPVHLLAQHCPLPVSSAAACNRQTAREYVRRVRETGVNFVIGGNYCFAEGKLSNIESILSVFDEEGLYYSFSMPHFKDFTGGGPFRNADEKARYRELVEKVVCLARNHPCVITYATSHNRTGYIGGQHPLNLDGRYEVPESQAWQRKVRATALACGDIISACDPTRPVYHHESGNLGAFHTSNTYLNWVPVQERGEWVADWASRGVKPLMFVEWGSPHVASWSSNREKNLFIWTKPAFQSLWGSEYAAAFRGDAAYAATAAERACLAQEEALWSTGKPFLYKDLSPLFYRCTDNFQGIQALYSSENLRVHRAYGVTMELPWDQNQRYDRVVERAPYDNAARFENLKTPGLVCDRFVPQEAYAYETGPASDWRRNVFGDTFARWWRPFIGWIGGSSNFTDRSHIVRPGSLVSRQLVFTNDRRHDVDVAWRVRLAGPEGSVVGATNGVTRVVSGTTRFVPLSLRMPQTPGPAELVAAFRVEGADEPGDAVTLEILPETVTRSAVPLFVYDPKGLTRKLFDRMSVPYSTTNLKTAPEVSAALVIGREALTRADMNCVIRPFAQRGGRVLVFEQTQETLEDLGFRVQTYGLRRVFPRYRDKRYGLLRAELLKDWAGEATLVPPYFERGDALAEYDYTDVPWAGFMNRHAWRCRNRGNVATVLPEKPSRGDWKSLCDGGFDLQYSPLLEQRVGAGTITFCQLDVTARTVVEPMAEEIVRALVAGCGPQPHVRTPAKALGGEAIRALRNHRVWQKQEPEFSGKSLFVISHGAVKPDDFDAKVKAGAKVLLLGLDADEVRAWSPVPLSVVSTNGCFYSRIERLPPELDGLSNGDWAWHGAQSFAAFTEPAADGNAALRVVRHGKGVLVFWQVPPWLLDDRAKPYLRTSRRRAEAMLARLLANLGFTTDEVGVHYADAPVAEDDPYRFERW